MDFLNNILLGLFLALAVYLSYGFIKTRKEVTIAAFKIDKTKLILFGVLMVMNVLTLIVNNTWLDIFRTIIITYVIIMMFLLKDGIGERGIVANSTFVSYDDIEIYDYETVKNGFKVYFGYRSASERKKQKAIYEASIIFDSKQEKEVKDKLQQNLAKKYRRMKKF